MLKGEGQCTLPGDDTVAGKPGNNGSAAHAYNTRFGIYQGKPRHHPMTAFLILPAMRWYSETDLTQPALILP